MRHIRRISATNVDVSWDTKQIPENNRDGNDNGQFSSLATPELMLTLSASTMCSLDADSDAKGVEIGIVDDVQISRLLLHHKLIAVLRPVVFWSLLLEKSN